MAVHIVTLNNLQLLFQIGKLYIFYLLQTSTALSVSSSPSTVSKTTTPNKKKPNSKKLETDMASANVSTHVISIKKEHVKSSSPSLKIKHDEANVNKNSIGKSKSKSDVINCNGNSADSFRNSMKAATEKEKVSVPLAVAVNVTKTTAAEIRCKNSSSKADGGIKQPPTSKEELDYLASVLDFSVTYTNFPQKNKTDIVTLVKLTTNPPKVCIFDFHHNVFYYEPT